MRNDVVIAPGGWRHRAEVRLVQPGGTVPAGGHQASARRFARPGVPDTANWITSGYWTNGSGQILAGLRSTWVVPPPPATDAGQILYLFSGAQPADGRTIVQPVLQWGDSGADEDGVNRTGSFWTAASWIVGASANHTAHVRVQPGDVLTGAVTLAAISAAGLSYHCAFLGLAGTDFVTPPIAELVGCVHTLEAYEADPTLPVPYDLHDATEYPDTAMTAFSAIDIATVAGPGPAGTWRPWDIVENRGEHTVITMDASTGGAMTIYYRAAPGMEMSP
jgi:hypothetical protein